MLTDEKSCCPLLDAIMSGCPVVQDGKLVGVVTHVFVNDPTRGYCVYAEWMYEKMREAATG